MQRRDLLKAWASLSLAAAGGKLWAAPTGNARLLVVFLSGGYDAANLLVPFSSEFYYQARPTIAIARPGVGAQSALALDANWGLHPALQRSLYPLYGAGQLAFIPFAGTDDVSRSHFDTQDTMALGVGAAGSRGGRSGFLNRLAMTLGGASAMAFTEQLPLIMQGKLPVSNVALRSSCRPVVDARRSDIIKAMYRNSVLGAQVDAGFVVSDDVSGVLLAEADAATHNAPAALQTQGFELEAVRIARLMLDKYTIGYVDVGGWDTHVGQGGASGYLAGRFEELGRGLGAYAQQMGSGWRNTVVVVISEFGRTFHENGNRGTDHGHGSVYWVLGGAINGGRVAGEQVALTRQTLFQQRDYPVLNEYRALFSGLFARMYGLNPGQLDQIFGGVKGRDLGLI